MDKALDAAVTAYDDARCKAHGGDKPMSERNRETIAPMIEAAVHAYLAAALPATDTRGLVERLRAHMGLADMQAVLADCREAADIIEALERENAGLEEACDETLAVAVRNKDRAEKAEARLAEAEAVIERLADAAEGVSWSSNTSLMNGDIERARSYLEGRK